MKWKFEMYYADDDVDEYTVEGFDVDYVLASKRYWLEETQEHFNTRVEVEARLKTLKGESA